MTRPALFADYLAEQLDILMADYDVEIDTAPGQYEIPFAYVIDANDGLADVRAKDLSRWFPTTELAHIGDEIADGVLIDDGVDPLPLALFDALRTPILAGEAAALYRNAARACAGVCAVHQLPSLCRRIRGVEPFATRW